MLKLDPNDDDARAQVKLFCDLVFDLRILHDLGKELFHDEQAQWLMEKTAHHFFFDLNRIMINYFLLQVAKLADPPTSCGRYENFSIANLIEHIEWPEDVLVRLKDLSQSVYEFHEYIKPARNKILAHYDKKTIMSGATLGVFPEGEDDKVVNVLEEMCNVLHQASFGEICGRMVCAHPGDVRDLKWALRNALAFEKLLGVSKGAELQRLHKCREDVDKGNV